MAIPRREFLRICGLLGITPSAAQLAACSDDQVSGDDAGADLGSDVGADAPNDIGSDAGVDASPDVDAGPVEPVPDDLPEYDYDGADAADELFQHGVASGDPLADAVILWTRVTTDLEDEPEVWWEIAIDPNFIERKQVGTFQTDGGRDFTVKIDVGELEPGHHYFYRFKYRGQTSPVGRTRTAPTGSVENLRFAVVSCASYTSGYYHAYRSIAERSDLHAVLHLGDYIYEGGATYLQVVEERRNEPPHEIITLEDYRTRYAWYRLDPDLREVHRQHPMIAVWDDHEIVNNSWREGAESHGDNEGDYLERKQIAWQAWVEWMPARETGEELRIWRNFQYGDLAELIMLDTRIWDRDEPVTRGNMEGIDDPDRSILGEEQAMWLDSRLCNSDAQWKIIGQQVMMAHWQVGGNPLNPDQWDGYPGSRERFLQTLADCAVDDVVVLTGDIHSTWANDLAVDPYDPLIYDEETGDGSLAVEFVCTSVTTQSIGDVPEFGDALADMNPHMKWVDLGRKGYVVLDLTPERAQGAWYHFEDITKPDRGEAGEAFARAFSTTSGQNRLREDETPAEPASAGPEPAP